MNKSAGIAAQPRWGLRGVTVIAVAAVIWAVFARLLPVFMPQGGAMFHQILAPVAGNLPLSVLVAAMPIATVLVAMGVLHRPAWQASLAGVLVGLAIATLIFRFPLGLALDSTAAGAVFALWPVMWVVFAGILLYNIAVLSGRFDALRDWVLDHLPNDRRIVLVAIGFCFACLL